MAFNRCLTSLRYVGRTRLGLGTLLRDTNLGSGRASVPGPRILHTTGVVPHGIQGLPRGRHTIPETREQVEVSTAEWSYVERLMHPTAIPKPCAMPGEVMPSGWVAPSAKIGDYPYFVPRSTNHMIPVYLKHVQILQRFITSVKHVEGDIFALGEELQDYLQQRIPKKYIIVRVHEPHQVIQIKGNFVAEVKEFLLEKGF
ncbi:large ribosomal subunit protein mL49 [Panulirus ornatus]|uniref:large ribosomal subunit protein mL49 n=1 Tax=Panulirus ornatus TaxID=150431 RepID=UPI003A88C9E5